MENAELLIGILETLLTWTVKSGDDTGSRVDPVRDERHLVILQVELVGGVESSLRQGEIVLVGGDGHDFLATLRQFAVHLYPASPVGPVENHVGGLCLVW